MAGWRSICGAGGVFVFAYGAFECACSECAFAISRMKLKAILVILGAAVLMTCDVLRNTTHSFDSSTNRSPAHHITHVNLINIYTAKSLVEVSLTMMFRVSVQ